MFVTPQLQEFSIEKKKSPTPPYKIIQAIADGFEPKLRLAIVKAIAEVKDGIVLAQVQRALENGDLAAAEAAIPWDEVSNDLLTTEITRVLRDTMEEAGIASEDLLPGQSVMRFDIVNPRAVEWARNESATLVTQVSDETKRAIRGIIGRAFEEGMHPYVSARLIRSQVGLTDLLAKAVDNYRKAQIEAGVKQETVIARADRYAKKLLNYRAKNIARTESLRASNMGQQMLWEQAADEGIINRFTFRKVWLATPGDRTCPICIAMDGQTVSLHQEFTGYRRNASGAIAEIYSPLVPPAHPSCLVQDTKVSACGRIGGVSKRWYEGDVVTVRTATGRNLNATPNHPILTDCGWLPIGQIQKGANIICQGICEGSSFRVYDDVKHVPASIQNIVDTFLLSLSTIVRETPITANDFHGDASDGQVAIIGADRMLPDSIDSALGQFRNDSTFIRTHNTQAFLPSTSPLEYFPERALLPLTSSSARSAEFPKNFRRLVGMKQDSSFLSITDDSNPPQMLKHGSWVDAESLRDLISAGSPFVSLDKVVDVSVRNFHGHVYNLETESGVYIANGIVSHNCRCAVFSRVER